MALIPEDKIAEVRDRTDIVQVVGDYVSLRKSGVNHKGLCPFHAEKTPSFNVNSQKQIFHCFGCGKSGDVIGFIMEIEGRPFVEVVRDLAKRAGIELPDPRAEVPAHVREARARADADRTRLVRVNQLAAEFYRAEYASARGARARGYVERRGVPPAVVDSFQIGYAPPGWDGLVRLFESKKVPHEVAERSGLIRARDNVKLAPGAPPTKATHFDLFRDRVMFPIINLHGEVVAFSGRVIESNTEAPKYINSPETPIFKKGENLFGLHAAKQGMRRSKRAILVEGNFDVVMMHVHGLTETVAPLGTALTPGQAHLLHRFAPERVYMFLDGDAAGSKAAARNAPTFLDEDLLAFVALMPKGDDPDTYVHKHGKEGVELLLKSAKELVEYFCLYAWNQSGLSIPERVRLLQDEVAPIIAKVKTPAARQRYAGTLAQGLDLSREEIEHAMFSVRPTNSQRPENRSQETANRANSAVARGSDSPAANAAPQQPEKPTQLSATDTEIVALIADHPRLIVRLGPLGVLRWVQEAALREALSSLSRRAGESAIVDARTLGDAVPVALKPQVMQAAMSGRYADVPDPERALRSIAKKVEVDQLLKELKSTLQAARAAGDEAEQRRINARIAELKQQSLGLKG